MPRVAPRDGPSRITGHVACLFPGAPDLDAYWRNILGKVDASPTRRPRRGTPTSTTTPTSPTQDATYCKRGGYLGALASFDPLAHGIPPVAVGGEPDQWLALQVAHDALADAGCDRPAGGGPRAHGDHARQGHLPQRRQRDRRPARARRRPDARAARAGCIPSTPTQSSSVLREELQARAAAARPGDRARADPEHHRRADRQPARPDGADLHGRRGVRVVARRGRARGARPARPASATSRWPAARRSGCRCRRSTSSAGSARCRAPSSIRPFDKDADGTLLGEGIGMVVLKRADGRASATATASTPSSAASAWPATAAASSVMAPRVEGEELALRRAYAEAGVDAGDRRAHRGARHRHAGRRRRRDRRRSTRVFGERRRRAAALRARHGQVDDQPHDPGGGHRRGDQDRAGAPPPGAAADAELSTSRTRSSSSSSTPVLPQHRDAAVDPRRRGAAPRRASTPSASAASTRTRCSRSSTARAGADHRPPWDSEVCPPRGRVGADALADAGRGAGRAARRGARRRRARRPRLHAQPPRSARPARRCASRSSRPRSPTCARSSSRRVAKLRKPGLPADQGRLGHLLRGRAARRATARSCVVFPGEGAQYPGMLADLCLHFPEVREVFDRDRPALRRPRRAATCSSDWVFPRPAFTDDERARDRASG